MNVTLGLLEWVYEGLLYGWIMFEQFKLATSVLVLKSVTKVFYVLFNYSIFENSF